MKTTILEETIKNARTIEVYVKGDAHTPARFWDYAIRTDYKKSSGARDYVEMGFSFSQSDTDLFKSLSDEKKMKVKFLYINGVKTI